MNGLEGEGIVVGVSEEARPHRREKAHRAMDSKREERMIVREASVATESVPWWCVVAEVALS